MKVGTELDFKVYYISAGLDRARSANYAGQECYLNVTKDELPYRFGSCLTFWILKIFKGFDDWGGLLLRQGPVTGAFGRIGRLQWSWITGQDRGVLVLKSGYHYCLVLGILSL